MRLLAAARALSSTSRMNSSSSRLTLLRMLSTCDTLRGELREDLVQALPSRHLDLQRVIIGQLVLNPGSAGGVRSGSRRLNTNISVCSLRSTFAMLSRSMMRPPSMMATLRHRFSASSR